MDIDISDYISDHRKAIFKCETLSLSQNIALEIPKPINLLSFFYLITDVILQN